MYMPGPELKACGVILNVVWETNQHILAGQRQAHSSPSLAPGFLNRGSRLAVACASLHKAQQPIGTPLKATMSIARQRSCTKCTHERRTAGAPTIVQRRSPISRGVAFQVLFQSPLQPLIIPSHPLQLQLGCRGGCLCLGSGLTGWVTDAGDGHHWVPLRWDSHPVTHPTPTMLASTIISRLT